jgi:hypothetical protein
MLPLPPGAVHRRVTELRVGLRATRLVTAEGGLVSRGAVGSLSSEQPDIAHSIVIKPQEAARAILNPLGMVALPSSGPGKSLWSFHDGIFIFGDCRINIVFPVEPGKISASVLPFRQVRSLNMARFPLSLSLHSPSGPARKAQRATFPTSEQSRYTLLTTRLLMKTPAARKRASTRIVMTGAVKSGTGRGSITWTI